MAIGTGSGRTGPLDRQPAARSRRAAVETIRRESRYTSSFVARIDCQPASAKASKRARSKANWRASVLWWSPSYSTSTRNSGHARSGCSSPSGVATAGATQARGNPAAASTSRRWVSALERTPASESARARRSAAAPARRELCASIRSMSVKAEGSSTSRSASTSATRSGSARSDAVVSATAPGDATRSGTSSPALVGTKRVDHEGSGNPRW